jgi:hypothetical protein
MFNKKSIWESGQAELNRYYTHPKGKDCRYPMARLFCFLSDFFNTFGAGLNFFAAI